MSSDSTDIVSGLLCELMGEVGLDRSHHESAKMIAEISIERVMILLPNSVNKPRAAFAL